MSVRCKMTVIPAVCASVLVAVLVACRTSSPGAGTSPGGPQPTQQPGAVVPGHEGRPYDIVSGESLLTILAFRGGTLAKAGHNHVIAAHDVTGTIYVPSDVLRSSFELRLSVAELTVDEPELRTREGADFPPEVPQSAREGTRRNMLGEALLNGALFPQITLLSERIEPLANDQRTAGGSVPAAAHDAEARVLATVQATVRGQAHELAVPVHYALRGDLITADGEVTVKQSQLGLTPFSAMLGALQVQDEMRVGFHFVAHAAPTRSK